MNDTQNGERKSGMSLVDAFIYDTQKRPLRKGAEVITIQVVDLYRNDRRVGLYLKRLGYIGVFFSQKMLKSNGPLKRRRQMSTGKHTINKLLNFA